jgi:hypothetical protein
MSLTPAPLMPIRSLTLALALSLSSLGWMPEVSSQELGVFVFRGNSEMLEFPDPVGVGLFASVEIQDTWSFRLTVQSFSQSTQKEGRVCVRYLPPLSCRTEHVQTSASMSGLRGTLSRAIPLGERLRLGVGGGFSFNSVAVTSTGESGYPADLERPRTGQIGYLGVLDAEVTPVSAWPLRLILGVTGHWVSFNACYPGLSSYSPFCGLTDFREIKVGLAFARRRGGQP